MSGSPGKPAILAAPEPASGFRHWMGRNTWRLVLLFAGVLLPLAGFVALADEVHEFESFHFDAPLLWQMHGLHSPSLDRCFVLLSKLGYEWFLIPADVLIVGALLWRRRWREATFVAVCFVGSALLNMGSKQFFQARPPQPVGIDRAGIDVQLPQRARDGQHDPGRDPGAAGVEHPLALAGPGAGAAVQPAGQPLAGLPRGALPLRYPRRMVCGAGLGGRVLSGHVQSPATLATPRFAASSGQRSDRNRGVTWMPLRGRPCSSRLFRCNGFCGTGGNIDVRRM